MQVKPKQSHIIIISCHSKMNNSSDLRNMLLKRKNQSKRINNKEKLHETSTTNNTEHWSHNLLNAFNDPSQVLKEDDDIIVLLDKYPKARHHLLILPKKNILNVKSLAFDDLELIVKMEQVGLNYAAYFESVEFK